MVLGWAGGEGGGCIQRVSLVWGNSLIANSLQMPFSHVLRDYLRKANVKSDEHRPHKY